MILKLIKKYFISDLKKGFSHILLHILSPCTLFCCIIFLADVMKLHKNNLAFATGCSNAGTAARLLRFEFYCQGIWTNRNALIFLWLSIKSHRICIAISEMKS
jgi:hypothetical protein